MGIGKTMSVDKFFIGHLFSSTGPISSFHQVMGNFNLICLILYWITGGWGGEVPQV
jgi:hypothetical protein